MKTLERIITSGKIFIGVTLFVGAITVGSIIVGCKLPGIPEPPPEPLPYSGPITEIVFTERNFNEADSSYDIDLWVVNTDGTGLKKIYEGTSFEKDSDFFIEVFGQLRLSPNGELVAIGGEDYIHRVIDLEGRVLHEFEGGRRSVEDFVWTPDGSSILFGLYGGQHDIPNGGIYRYSLEDSKREKIVHQISYVYKHNPVMSPNSEKIVFTHHEYEQHYYIYTVDIYGGNLELITEGKGSYYDEQLGLKWLDERHIIFKNSKKDKLYYFDIETKEGREIELATSYVTNWPERMRLSPDRSILALWGVELSFVNTSDIPTGVVNKHYTGIQLNCMAWSPDGNYFVVGKESLDIYDVEGNQYIFLEKDNLPMEIDYIMDVGWAVRL